MSEQLYTLAQLSQVAHDAAEAMRRRIIEEAAGIIGEAPIRRRAMRVDLTELVAGISVPTSVESPSTRRLAGLRALLGHVQDGSDTCLSIFQDDATMEFIIKWGLKYQHRVSGSSFYTALDRVVEHVNTSNDNT